jgi:bacterial/archaeal transporter family protein
MNSLVRVARTYSVAFNGIPRFRGEMAATAILGCALMSNWLPWAVLSAVFAAATAIFTKIGVRTSDSNVAVLVHTAVVMGVLLVVNFFGAAGTKFPALQAKALGWLVASGLATAASWMCYFHALKLGDASKVAPVDKLSVVFVAVFAFLFLAERPGWREWLGIVLVGAGVLLISFKK